VSDPAPAKSAGANGWEIRRQRYGKTGRTPEGNVKQRKASIPGATREIPPKPPVKDIDPKAVYEAVGFGVVMAAGVLNTGVPMFFGPEAWTDEDKLTGTEIGMLTAALGDEALDNKQLARWLTKIGRGNKHARLTYTLFIIAAPRLARRGMLPKEVVSVLNDVNAAGGTVIPFPGQQPEPEQPPQPGPDFDFDPAAVPVASGRTPDDDGGYGQREVNPGGIPEQVPAVVRDAPVEARRRSLRREENQNGSGDSEPALSPAGTVAE